MKHHPRLKRGLALALSALCLASLCAGVVSAAPASSSSTNPRIGLEYQFNRIWDALNKDQGIQTDTSKTAYILTGKTVTVQMSLGDADLPTESGKSTALVVTPKTDADKFDTSDGKLSVTGTGQPGRYQITASNIGGDNKQVQMSVEANINSVTTNNGYNGTVSARKDNAATTNPVGGDAKLLTPLAISQTSWIRVECTEGEYGNFQPTFKVTGADGVFAPYLNGSVAFRKESDTGSAFIRNKRVVIEVSAAGQTPLTFQFDQPLTYDSIMSRNRTDLFLDGKGNPQMDPKDPTKPLPESDPAFVRVANNYVRYGSTYTLTFVKPISDILSLNIATPQYVVNQIAENIESNLEESYLKLTPGDRPSMLTGDIELTTYDFRYNAEFDIAWEWTPTLAAQRPQEYATDEAYKEAAMNALRTPSANQGTAEKPTATVSLRPLIDNISGTLTATVTCRDEAGKADRAVATYVFENIIVRGKGIPASVKVTGAMVGKEGGAVSVADGESNAKLGALAAQLKMDVFQGLKNYSKSASAPCIYTMDLNMGQKNARSQYAVVTLEGDTNAVSLYVEDQQYTPGAQIENPHASESYDDEGKCKLEVRAVQEGTVTLKIDYYVLINSKPVVDSSYSTQIVVTDSTPSRDATLSALTLRDAGRKEPAIGFGFQPERIMYTDPVIELPYVYEEYDLTPVINEPVAREKAVTAAAFDSSGKPAAIFVNPKAGSTASLIAAAGDLTTNPPAAAPDPLVSTVQVMSGKSLRIKIPEADVGKVYTVTLTVQAAHPEVTNVYTLAVTRLRPSEDDMLRSLGVYAQADTAGKTNYITDFNPETRDYVITVPYSTKYLRISAEPNFRRAETFFLPNLKSMTLFGAKEYLEVASLKEKDTFQGVELPYFNVYVTPEANLPNKRIPGADGQETLEDMDKATGHYRIFVNRLPPSEESRMTGLTIVDAADADANPKALPYVPAFNANNPGPYRMTDTNAVPYSTSAVRFKITPQDALVSAIRIYRVETGGTSSAGRAARAADSSTAPPDSSSTGTPDSGSGSSSTGGNTGDTGNTGGSTGEKRTLVATITNPAVFSEPIALTARSTEFLYNEFVVQIVSEAGDGQTGEALDKLNHKEYYTEYRVQIERAEANTDADLLSVALNDQAGTPLKMFAFHRDETNYSIKVPYASRSVSFTAKLSDPHASIQLKDHDNLIHAAGIKLDEIVSERSTKLYSLNDPGAPRTFDLIVTAEDGITTKTYTFIIDREPPSTDALLKKLTVDGLTEDGLSPLFKPNDTAYSGTVAEGAEGVAITPTANDKNATIMVDGISVESGKASELIELLEEKVKLDIVVTAEDGKTQKTYTLDLFNQNLVEKTNDADLSALLVERGVMTPEFKAAVTEYEVAVKEDTYSVDIIPKPDDPLAEVKVLNGTRELGDYNGNYALALADGENKVTVQVTSPDKTQVKEYNVSIYRNQEDALKTLTPLTADDVDFENSDNPIVISVAEYPRIESSVFSALKEYPEKTIIFQGLDYSLTFQAANLNTVIPTREIYDFRLSFESLDADEIRAYMGGWDANAEIMGDLVMIYFDYHGDLPGPAMLNLKLGNKYGGQTLYWHYYNRERKKIEYYGSLRSNAQGSISVPLNHFSTYLLTRVRSIAGAENYSNTLSQIRATIGAKQNPTTAADEAPALPNPPDVMPDTAQKPSGEPPELPNPPDAMPDTAQKPSGKPDEAAGTGDGA